MFSDGELCKWGLYGKPVDDDEEEVGDDEYQTSEKDCDSETNEKAGCDPLLGRDTDRSEVGAISLENEESEEGMEMSKLMKLMGLPVTFGKKNYPENKVRISN